MFAIMIVLLSNNSIGGTYLVDEKGAKLETLDATKTYAEKIYAGLSNRHQYKVCIFELKVEAGLPVALDWKNVTTPTKA